MTADLVSEPQFGERVVVTEREGRLPFLVMMNDPLDSELFQYVPLRPILVNEQQPRVVFYLAQQPTSRDYELRPYLEKGLFELALRLDLPADGLDQLDQPCQRLFWERATVELVDTTGRILQTVQLTDFGQPVCQLRTVLAPSDCDALYEALCNRPSSLHLRLTIVCVVPGVVDSNKPSPHTVVSETPLRQVVQPLTASVQVLTNLIVYQCFNALSGTYESLAPRIQYSLARERARGDMPKLALVKVGGQLESVGQAIRPTAIINANALMKPATATFLPSAALYRINDLAIIAQPTTEQVLSIPIVRDETSAFWSDRVDPNRYWCLPAFQLLIPQLSDAPENSPFRFLFRRIGVDPNGLPILEGEIRLRVRQYIPAELVTAVQKQNAAGQLRSVGTGGISFQLHLPFRRSTDGRADVTTISTVETTQAGTDTTLIFRLTNEWIKGCYSVMSNDAQQPPVRLVVNYTFEGYVPLKSDRIDWTMNNKLVQIQVLTTQNRARSTATSYFDATQKKLVLDTGQEINFRDSVVARGPALMANRLTTHVALSSVNVATLAVQPAVTVGQPIISVKQKYARQSFGKSVALDVVFSCITYGAFYLENSGGTTTAIGCREPYKLGQVQPSLYTELNQLSTGSYRVYRSNQSPNSFLVVPFRYAVTRYASSEGTKAYKPCIYLYSAIQDPEHMADSVWVIDLALEPKLTYAERIALEAQLCQFTAYEPAVHYLTELVNEPEFVLSAVSAADLRAYSLGNSIRLTISTRIEQALTLIAMLRNGALSGKATFRLPDDSRYEVALTTDLSAIVGPWDTGPVGVSVAGNVVQFTNHIESAINLLRVFVYLNNQLVNTINIGTVLPADQVYTQVIDQLPVNAKVIADYSIPAGGVVPIQELNNYVEDIRCQVIFLTTIDLTAQNITLISIECRLKESSHTETLVLNATRTSGEVQLLMPMTTFLSDRIVEFRTITQLTTTTPIVSGWQSCALGSNGNLINLTSAVIFQSLNS